MKTKRILGVMAGLAMLAAGPAANAVTLTTSSPEYLGLIVDGISSSPANEVLYINSLILVAANTLDPECNLATSEVCDRRGSLLAGPFSSASTTGAGKDESGNTTPNGTGVFQYILGKYDQDTAGSLVWYFAGGIDISTIDLQSTLNGKALSHISWYNEYSDSDTDSDAPEPGTLALLGLGLLGLGATRRRRI